MEPNDTENELENKARDGRTALKEALDGKRDLTWEIWSSPLYGSPFLTAEGRRVAEWAVKVLRTCLGNDFLQRVRADDAEHPLISPALLTSLWPMIDSRRVYEDLFRLSAQISLCIPASKGWRALRTIISRNFDQTSWTHSLIQLELAGLAQRHGWECEFEPTLSTGRPGDVRLEKDGHAIAVEVTSVGMSHPVQVAHQYFREMSMRLLDIEMQYSVCVHGDVGDNMPPEERDQWIKEIDEAARSTAQDGLERFVSGPAEAAVWVSSEALRPGETHLQGPGGQTDIWSRINARISQKGQKTLGSGKTWIRLQEHVGLWLSTLRPDMSFMDRVGIIAPQVRSMLGPFPHITGVVISPGPMWLDIEPMEQTITLPNMPGVVGHRRPFAQGRIRETIIVSRSDRMDPEGSVFADLSGQEGIWQEWALERLGHLGVDALFQ